MSKSGLKDLATLTRRVPVVYTSSMGTFARLILPAVLACGSLGTMGETRPAQSTVQTLSVSELGTRYDSLIGQRVKVEGFLLLDTNRPTLSQGAPRESQVYLAHKGQKADHWCAFSAEPRPVAVHGLAVPSISKVAKFARRKGILVAQRVILEGAVGQADVTYEP